jgi:hypothetical protein
MYMKEIFLKNVLVCSLEVIFFINIVKNMPIEETLNIVHLKSFDFWRLLGSFIKFDVSMPKNLLNHFKEIE